MKNLGVLSASHVVAAVMIIAFAIVTPSGAVSAPPRLARGSVTVESVLSLDDGTLPVLGRPGRISRDARGRYVITDGSDEDIKIYDARGKRVGTLGRPGQGPGEFEVLFDSDVVGSHVVGYDFMTSKLTFFEESGAVARIVDLGRPSPWRVRVADEETLVLVGSPFDRGNLLRVSDLEGNVSAAFFPLEEQWITPPEILQHIWFLADGLNGLVFSAMWGGDRLRAFNYAGALLADGAIDQQDALVALPTLVREHGGKVRDNAGLSVQHGNRVVMNVVATADSTVTMQVAPFDTETGADLLEGGTVIVLRYAAGAFQEIGRIESEWGLLGRDRDGAPMVMRYDPSSPDKYEIGRLAWPPSGHVNGKPSR